MKPAVLVVRPTNGLCNRLGVLTSFTVLARRSNRQLRVCWTGGPGWSDEDLDDLFENAVDRLGVAEFANLARGALRLDELMTLDGVDGLNRTWGPANRHALAAVFDTRSNPVVVYDGGRRCQDLLAPEHRRRLLPRFEADYVNELRAWRPVRGIREHVARLTAAFDPSTVGVHVRRGDALNHPSLSSEYRRSPDAAFIGSMNRIVRRTPATTFYLATDSESTERLFTERFGDRIRLNPEKRFVPSVIGAAKENQRDAVIDLFALAGTRLILGSHYSSFSTTAARLEGARLRIVVSDSPLGRLHRKAAFGRHEAKRRWRSARSRR